MGSFSEYLLVQSALYGKPIRKLIDVVKENLADIDYPEVDETIINNPPRYLRNKSKKVLKRHQQDFERIKPEFKYYFQVIKNTIIGKYCKVLLCSATLGNNISTVKDYSDVFSDLKFKYKVITECPDSNNNVSLVDKECLTYICWVSLGVDDIKRKQQIQQSLAKIKGA